MSQTSDLENVSAFAGFVDLASAPLGGEAMLCSDDFFAGMDNLLKPEPAIFLPDEYTERGKWMDGWESRRKRVPGHDWCIIRLGVPGRIRGVDIDTAFFLGNHPPFASMEACHAPGATAEVLRDEVEWTVVVAQTALRRGSHNLAPVEADGTWTHVRLNMYPAGGIARLRVYGDPAVDEAASEAVVDLACTTNGGQALACSDMFFSPMSNLLLPTASENMGQGWETRRSRPPGDDWILIALGQPGAIERVVVDTAWFKGNYPDRCAIDAVYWPGAPPHALTRWEDWSPLVPDAKLRADHAHELAVADPGPWTHLRLRIFPDGGVARLRVFGRPDATQPGSSDALVAGLNGLSATDATAAFMRCCGSARWASRMAAARPFASRSHLMGEAEQVWWHLGDGDWLEAFTHHPRIGADVAKLREKFQATSEWSSSEQSGVSAAGEETLQALAAGNQAYEARYGHIFIVCASGLSAAEMLARLQQRMDNEPAAELSTAAGEQAKITRLRLEKLEP